MKQYHLKMEDTSCNHAHVSVIKTPDGPHHAKRVCAHCGKFLGWEAKPANIARIEQNSKRHKVLCGLNLSVREREFMESCQKQKFRLTEKQQTWFDGIWMRMNK